MEEKYLLERRSDVGAGFPETHDGAEHLCFFCFIFLFCPLPNMEVRVREGLGKPLKTMWLKRCVEDEEVQRLLAFVSYMKSYKSSRIMIIFSSSNLNSIVINFWKSITFVVFKLNLFQRSSIERFSVSPALVIFCINDMTSR